MSQLWNELHQRALSYKGKDDSAFLKTWAAKLPRFTTGCACKEFWRAWSILNKPIYEPEGGYFAWSVKAHNSVNIKLGKRTYTIEEALALMGRPNAIPKANLKELNDYLKRPPYRRTVQRSTYKPTTTTRITRSLNQVGNVTEGVKEKDIEAARKRNEELARQYKANKNKNTKVPPGTSRFTRQTSNVKFSSLRPRPNIQKNLWLPTKKR